MNMRNWMKDIPKDGSSLKGSHTPETLEYGVSGFYWTSERPFHPQRLYSWFVAHFVRRAAHFHKKTRVHHESFPSPKCVKQRIIIVTFVRRLRCDRAGPQGSRFRGRRTARQRQDRGNRR
mmetsp:Transcript_26378/g.105586  ORF Transcript_26378/g.105586 Transcript_26378/m.105586 type:complete len:120 (+) Transcript_26378:1572-1931(+)